MKIISNGFTGAARAALMAAKQAGFETGGWAAGNQWLFDDGPHPEFESLYKLQPLHFSGDVLRQSLSLNVCESDGTLRVAESFAEPYQDFVWDRLQQYHKPQQPIFLRDRGKEIVKPPTVAKWILARNIRTLNVMGDLESQVPGAQEYVVSYLQEVFKLVTSGAP